MSFEFWHGDGACAQAAKAFQLVQLIKLSNCAVLNASLGEGFVGGVAGKNLVLHNSGLWFPSL
jgi:hypothetical protein